SRLPPGAAALDRRGDGRVLCLDARVGRLPCRVDGKVRAALGRGALLPAAECSHSRRRGRGVADWAVVAATRCLVRRGTARKDWTMNLIRTLARVALALFACAAAAAGAETPQLSVTPPTGPVDAPLHVVTRNILPGTRVRVSASRPDARGRNWTAVGEYFADA